MSVAAYALPVCRPCDWVEESATILNQWDSLPDAAKAAVVVAVWSILADPAKPRVDVPRAKRALRNKECTLLRTLHWRHLVAEKHPRAPSADRESRPVAELDKPFPRVGPLFTVAVLDFGA